MTALEHIDETVDKFRKWLKGRRGWSSCYSRPSSCGQPNVYDIVIRADKDAPCGEDIAFQVSRHEFVMRSESDLLELFIRRFSEAAIMPHEGEEKPDGYYERLGKEIVGTLRQASARVPFCAGSVLYLTKDDHRALHAMMAQWNPAQTPYSQDDEYKFRGKTKIRCEK